MDRAEMDLLIEQTATLDATPDAEIGEIARVDRTPAGMRIRSRNYRNELVTTVAGTLAECRKKHSEEINKAYPKGACDY